MKASSQIIALAIIVVAIMLINQSQLFTIYTPQTPDSSLNRVVNKLYFPLTTKTTGEACPAPDKIGSSIAWDSKVLPTSTSCLALNNVYYKLSSIVTKKGTCTNEGEQVLIDGNAPFMNLILIKKTVNNQVSYLICQNKPKGLYSYKFLVTTSSCSLKYSVPPIQEVVKYSCDARAKTIYQVPCGKKRTVVEKCALGCEQKYITIDTGNVEVVKCIGDYQPNKVICSPSGRNLFKTSSTGQLSSEPCCSCSGTTCSKTGCTLLPLGCSLIDGDGSGNIDIFFYNDTDNVAYESWAISQLATRAPYNEFTYNVYRENNKNDCRSDRETSNDVRIGWEDIGRYYGWGQPSPGVGTAGNLKFNPITYASITPTFLLFHELGHIYTHAGHTCDGSIMDANGGDRNYRPYQIDLIRKNLNSTTPIYNSTYRICIRGNL